MFSNPLKYPILKIKPYLASTGIGLRQKHLLFKLRTRMINVAANFGKSSNCPLGCSTIDDQKHLFLCKYLNDDQQMHKYSDIFSDNPKKLFNIANIAQKLIRKREEKILHQAK